MEEIVYLNGSLIPRSKAWISAFDHGFLYGYGLFETMRAYGTHTFRLGRHLARLTQAAEVLGLASKLDTFDLERATRDTLSANDLKDGSIRLTVSGGEGEMVPDPSTCRYPTVFIAARGYTPYPIQVYKRGFRAVLSSLRRDSQSPLSRIKSANYLINVLAKMEARASGADEALLLNELGFLAEGSTCNLFLVAGDILFTPSLKSGILPGITREAVLEMASGLGIEAREQKITLSELFEADEAFLTSSLLEIMPLTGLDGKPIGKAKSGAVTERLMAAYKELVERESQPQE
jgi:branched-chain amino acid aminotransferase group I